jgi:tRNA-2-methylthio-N6-dimethylallyladenosine synthase
MNENDSERIAGILQQSGAAKVPCPEEADLIIVNTCAVRAKSEEKFYSYLGRLAKLKKKKQVRIGVVGCVAQLRGLELLERQTFVDFVLGPDTYSRLGPLIQPTPPDKFISTEWSEEWHDTPAHVICRENRTSGYVTVMEGCNNFCAYCIVPYTRGREKFRPLPSILEEVRDLAGKGFKEVILLGQNVNCYRDRETQTDFPGLLQATAAVEGIEWIRFLSSHPKHLTAKIAEAMAATPKICRQLHLPLQSGSTAVLTRMNRGYTKEDYLAKVDFLRRLMPEISLSADTIVGFPGETEAEHEETIEALRRVRFANIFSFRYSPRPGTRASELADDVPFEVKRRRLEQVQQVQKAIQLETHSRFVGRAMKVLCTGWSKKTPRLMTGRNEGSQVVNFRSSEDCSGLFVDVRVTGFGPFSLHGVRVG